VAFVPLLVALAGWRGRPGRPGGPPPRRAFALGTLAGSTYFVGTLYWTGPVLTTFGGVPAALALLAMVLLALYLALFPALAALVTAHLVARAGSTALWLVPAVWVAAEYARGTLFGGFPWVPLGASQVTTLAVAQLASVAGVYGLSALVAFVNAAVAFAILNPGRPRRRALAAAAAAVLGASAWGAWRVADGALVREGAPLRVGLVQANVAQDDKWNPSEARRIFTTHLAMSRDVVRRGAQYVIWPESSTPFPFEDDPVGGAAVRALARELGVPILVGSNQFERGAAVRAFNAAFLVDPRGETAGVYRKMHLVPFGEYVPFRRWLSFVSPLVDDFGEFAPGESLALLPVGGRPTSTAICYEVVYPSLVREAVLGGSQLLTTITNDAWYGSSSAPYQHFALASMRAIEQGRYLARAANTGISGVVDPYGRVVAASGIFEQAGLVEEVRLLEGRTVYAMIGDAAAYAAIALTFAALIAVRRR
jgi:apolipoprotein N-acyltransferase